ncbi:MAG TPA: ElyC/SanA/YdcF family protein [Terriglobia bacterium]|nr:ElyC/SanA/YdcF family protein [Terriglobia bacterium]
MWFAFGTLSVGSIAFLWFSNRTVLASADGKIYTDLRAMPVERVGLVLGTAPTIHDRPNPFFLGRMEAAAQLYRAGKVQKILASGDNHSANYDEPTRMKTELMNLGVPEQDIALDYAGFRTFDSIVRAKKCLESTG